MGRRQAHQREARDRRGGQALIRLGRRATLLVALFLLTSTATASAEYAWVGYGWTGRDVARRPNQKHQGNRGSDLDGGVEGDRVWMACTCGAAMIKGLTQQQCLDLVYSSARTLRVKVEGIDDTVTSHSHAVRHYSGSLTREATQRFLAGLGDARFGARLAGGTTNPLAPCSLLQALVLARRLSAIWGRVMSVSVDVRAQATPPAAAEAAARLFAEALREAAAASELVVAAATQEDCLNSMFQPDVIRR